MGSPRRGNERLKKSILALVAAAAAACMVSPPAFSKTLKAYRHIFLDGSRVKWGSPQPGTGAVVTYATLQESVRFPTARNCRAMAPMAGLLAANHVDAATFQSELRIAFGLWSAAANIRFEPAASYESADILIGAQAVPHGRAFTNVEFDERESAAGGFAPLTRSLICLSPAERWKTGFDGNLQVYDLRYTLLHEIGHAIGLDHPAIASQLMDFRYNEKFRTPQRGDVLGVVALYGPSRSATASAASPESPRVATVKAVHEDAGG